MQIQKFSDIKLVPLTSDDKEQFILDNQEAFNYGALEEFGKRDEHLDEEGQIISRKVIEDSIADGEAYRIIKNNEKVGGLVIKTTGDRGLLNFYLFLLKNIVKALVMLHGASLNRCIRR